MTILLERHKAGCNCSYCGDGYLKPMRFGLNIPADWWAHNAWYVIKFWPRRYLRWTNSWLRREKTTQKPWLVDRAGTVYKPSKRVVLRGKQN